MDTIQIVYYAFMIASVLCGAAFKIGYELGKNSKQTSKHSRRKNTKSNCPHAKR